MAQVDINAGRLGAGAPLEVLSLRWGPEAVARSGVSAPELAFALRSRLATRLPSFAVQIADQGLIGVRFEMAGAESLDLDALLAAPLLGTVDRPLGLRGLADFSTRAEPPWIERVNQQYKRQIEIQYQGPEALGIELLRSELAQLPAPRLPARAAGRPVPQHRTPPRGGLADRRHDPGGVPDHGGDFRVLAGSPAGDGQPAHRGGRGRRRLSWTGARLEEGAVLGMLLLIGVAVNDGILLVHRYRQLLVQRRRQPRATLAFLAIRERFRPMWATTFTSVAGMLPVFPAAEAGDFWHGQAVAVVGGLVSSTILMPAALTALVSLTGQPKQKDQET